MTSRTAHPLTILATLLVAFSLVACAQSAIEPGASPGRDGDNGAPMPSSATDGEGQYPDATDRRIIKTGELTIEVPDVGVALGRIRAMAVALGGYVGGSSSSESEGYATLTLRIPADQFDEALSRLHELDGEVLTEATREEDVTSAIVDLEARIRNLQASEDQYLALIDRAVTIEDILAVQTRLDEVRGQIEQYQAQLKDLSGLADLSTLTVSLVPGAVQQATEDWDPGKTVTDAFAALARFGQGLANGVIWFAIVWLPALVVLGVVVLLVLRFFPGLRRRIGPAAPPAAEKPAEPKG